MLFVLAGGAIGTLLVWSARLLAVPLELKAHGRAVRARPKLRMVDRALLAAAAFHLPRASGSVLLVTPRTLLR